MNDRLTYEYDDVYVLRAPTHGFLEPVAAYVRDTGLGPATGE
jgi:hypothetical protein